MTRSPALLRFAPLLLLAIAVAGESSLAAAEVTVETNVPVAMRDGVHLATDVYLPAEVNEPLPAIVTRTPYNKQGAKRLGEYFAAHGYAFVAQDTRGRYASEGVWHMLTDDGPDGQDTASWIAGQPWSNGTFGMIGTSYVGGTQHALAMAGSPHLKTVIPVDAMSNLGYASMRNGGAFELRFWNWIFLNAARGSRQAHDAGTASVLTEMANHRLHYLLNLPTRRGTTPLRHAEEYEDWLVTAMQTGGNTEFWKQNNIRDFTEQYQDMPVYLVGGWYDSWSSNTTANYQALSQQIAGPVYLIMGPWIHGAQSGHAHGQVNFGPAASIGDELAWRLAWYDRWLKGIENAVGREAPFATPVRIFVMGTGDGSRDDRGRLNHGGYWRDEQEWPLARAEQVPLYLHSGGRLTTEQPTAEPASTSYQYDPRNPVPTIGGCISSGNDILLQGAWDQRGGPHVWNLPEPIPLSARNDVLVFQTEPLAEDLEVTGELEVRLWVSSSAVDTDFTAKLIDVYPPSPDFPGGFDLLINDGIQRARFRDSLTEERLMTPGEVYELTVKLYPTSNVFKRGHRIRLDISSSNFPRFDPNPNTGEPLNDHRRSETATNTIHHDASRPSQILLPVVRKGG